MIAANDWTSDLETNGLPQIKSIYALYDAEDKVTGKHFDFEHNYNQVSREFMYEWMNRWLQLGQKSPVKEKRFIPLPPQELSVYDAQHPLPADSADAATLRKYMTTSSDAQLSTLRQQPEEYRRMLRVALRAMLQDSLPDPADIEWGHASASTLPGDIRLEKGTISRTGSGEQIPFVHLIPAGAGQGTVLWIDPGGKASLFDSAGNPAEAAKKILAHGDSIFAIDAFRSGEVAAGSTPTTNPTDVYEGATYAGFRFGYNRGLLANRVHDELTAIAAAHSKMRGELRMLAFGKAGVWRCWRERTAKRIQV